MSAYTQVQQREFALAGEGYTAVKHHRFVGTGYFDEVTKAVTHSNSTTALTGSTEEEQFAAAGTR